MSSDDKIKFPAIFKRTALKALVLEMASNHPAGGAVTRVDPELYLACEYAVKTTIMRALSRHQRTRKTLLVNG